MSTRTALVGGGGSGIGRGAAEALLDTGHRVVLTGRRPDRLERAAADLSAGGGEVGTIVADVADEASARQVLDRVDELFGGVDVLVLNAGGPRPGRVLEPSDDEWRAAFELLVLGPLRLAREALPGMAERGFGRVVVVTSTAVRQPQEGLALSTVLRAATTSAAKLLSREHAERGVTVNCVAPGATDTDRRREVLRARGDEDGRADVAAVPAGRPARPREIGDVVAFLASEQASFVNGTVVTVDGGRTETP